MTTAEEADPLQPEKRNLRRRRVNLNELSSLSKPKTCRFQFCGVQLSNGDSLKWHYEGHLAQELERLERGVRVKRNRADFPDHSTRRNIRRSAMERIKFRREVRQAIPIRERFNPQQQCHVRCPSCSEDVGEEDQLGPHLDKCLKEVSPSDVSGLEARNDSEVIDVEEVGYEEYEWAGQRRVRVTSLVEGGLRGAGFLTITKGDEDEELDVENDDKEETFGVLQYTDADILLPSPDSDDEGSGSEQDQSILRNAVIFPKCDSANKTDTGDLVKDIQTDKESDVRSATCNVCMDSYVKPLVSVACWHVHCEQCWLRALGVKKLCPQCKVIVGPQDLRKIFL